MEPNQSHSQSLRSFWLVVSNLQFPLITQNMSGTRLCPSPHVTMHLLVAWHATGSDFPFFCFAKYRCMTSQIFFVKMITDFFQWRLRKASDVIDITNSLVKMIYSCLNWNNHISSTAWRIYPKLKLLNRISSFLSHKILLNIYKQTVLPILCYGCIVWGDCSKRNAQCLEHLQNQAMQIILYTGNAYKVGFIVT